MLDGMPPRTTDHPGLQLSWADGEAVAWRPGESSHRLPHEVAALARRPSLAWTSPSRVIRVELPTGAASVLSQRLDATTLASLGQLHVLQGDVSPSVAWFGAVHAHATTLVLRGRVLPALQQTGPTWWEATWQPLAADVKAARPGLLAAMPPIVAAAGKVDPAEVLTTLVDRLCRLTLAGQGWHALLPDTRGVNSRAVRLVSRALVADHGRFAVAEELRAAVEHLEAEFSQMARRADGEPILRARLRLGLPAPGPDEAGWYDPFAEAPEPDEVDASHLSEPPAEPDEYWPLTLELVDVDDRGRWCTLADVANGTDAAHALAREPRFFGLLAQHLQQAANAVVAAVPEVAPWMANRAAFTDIDGAAAVLEAIGALEERGVELVAPERLVRRKPSTRGTARTNDGGGSGRFAAGALMDWRVVLDDTPVPEDALRRAAEEGANLIRVGGRWVQVDRTEARRALQHLKELRNEHGEVSALELLALAAELERSLEAAGQASAIPAIEAAEARGWAAQLLGGLPDTELTEGDVPEGFAAELRHYQRRGLGWLQFLHRLGLGGCLADDMGLGKTPTTLAHLAGLPGPHLVVCPLSVVRNWEAEAARFTPLVRVMVHHGGSRADAESFAHLVAGHDLVITTYQVATRDLAVLQQVQWSTLVLDEAQAVKNPDTRAAKAMRAIAAGQKIALTGTPVENRLSELWSIFQVVTPGLLGNATQFRQRFVTPIERERDADAAEELRRLTSPFLLRRTKADRSLVPDLPDKVEQIAWASLTREQAHLYQAVVDQLLKDAQEENGMRRRGLVLAALTRLKQICNHPAHALGDGSRLAGRSGKLHRFDELVEDLLDAGEHALVFTQFREMGVLLQQHLAEKFGQQVPFLHGGVAKANRDRMVAAFQHGSAVSPLLLVSLKAGGTGLNLTAASRVVHYDRWWNPAVEDQATDRAWRIGQQRSVFVHKLVCEGTVEERIDQLITDKRALADAVVGTTGEAWLSELSTDQLRDLVVLDHRAVRG